MKVMSVVLIVMLAAVAWFGSAVVRLENYHYANFVGLCTQFNIKDPRERIERETCLEQAETRTSWAWHLVYGLKIL
ncbi:hypothetical protein SAMN05192541_109299 [Bradyrhizobium arachidis]|uniref:Uncharacterized protein n=1 Tax=Bradyrhizobium arachidis TaxID=858423 RepID=A0AAE7TI36_9BRAD|nr:hypothetical protein WN72_24605 [Bradyrhizobium arachidis]SFV01099.1 hypothetical protein SAMN05192541_109299 [Bradyrhizobium arachidis]